MVFLRKEGMGRTGINHFPLSSPDGRDETDRKALISPVALACPADYMMNNLMRSQGEQPQHDTDQMRW